MSEYSAIESIQIPKVLFEDLRYKGLSTDAKVMYALLLDRKSVSALNGWKDHAGRLYVIYPKREMAQILNVTRYRIDQVMDELTKGVKLASVFQTEPGKALRIYIRDIVKQK